LQKYSNKLLFYFIILLNLIIVISEVFFGFLSNSIALITDAFHNLSDIVAVLITYVATVFATKKPTLRRTFGYIRSEVMATFINSFSLVLVMLFVMYESVHGFFDIQKIDSQSMIIVAFIALIGNTLSALILHKMHSQSHHHDTNIHSAYLHFLADSLLSVSVIIGGVIIYFFEFYLIDKILSVGFSIYIIYATFPLLKESFYSLMDIEHKIDINHIKRLLLSHPQIESFHDVHLIEPSSKHSFFYAHVIFNQDLKISEIEKILEQVKSQLEAIGINHFVIQPETKNKTEADLVKKTYKYY
jgi:cobalt-zinc-cadmium efflux system protein